MTKVKKVVMLFVTCVLVERKERSSLDHSNTRVARQGSGIAVVKILHDFTSTNVVVSESAIYKPRIIQHTKRMRVILLSSVGCLKLPDFFVLFHKWHDFQKRSLLDVNCVLIFSK